MGKFLLRSATVLLLLLLLLAGFVVFQVRRSFPQTEGELRIPGLKGRVEVYRDAHGVPHIYAGNEHDLFFAQGFVHAQDRFWQMDLWRHAGAGRLSEMFGKQQVERDRLLRTFGWSRIAAEEFRQADEQSRSILQSYAEGVNAYLQDRSPGELSLEHSLLSFTNRGYRPEAWTPIHSITWLKMMAWDLCANMYDEMNRALLSERFSADEIAQLYPPYPAQNPLIVSTGSLPSEREVAAAIPLRDPRFKQALKKTYSNVAVLNREGPMENGIGSNSWVVSGRHTSTGKPMLANDPHLSLQLPAIWYQVALHCDGCGWDVAGFSFAGVPGVILGHNAKVAWGFTNSGVDVMDLYVEKINPQNPLQYEVNGEWIDMRIVREKIQVADGSPVDMEVRYTRHGPVVSDTYEHLATLKNLKLDQYAISLRWTSLEPSFVFPALIQLNRASNWNDLREAAKLFHSPSQNIIYADTDGNIGYQLPGRIPMRPKGDGRLPVPGWTNEYEWSGYIPFDSLPYSYNPADGYIVTANNAVVAGHFPYLLTTDWDYGFRAKRITQMVEEKKGKISAAEMRNLQMDNFNSNAANLMPLLMKLNLADERLQRARDLFRDWDFQNHMDLSAPALFETFWKHLLHETFVDQLPPGSHPGGGSRWITVVANLARDPENFWWDDRRTKETENRDVIFARSFQKAVDELEQHLGNDPSKWTWGQLHTTTFRNSTFGRSGIRPIEMIFNRGPFPTSGGSSIVNATGWNVSRSFEVTSVPSMRMMIDLSDLNQSSTILTAGQSGRPFHPHYIDMAESWRNGEQYQMIWTRADVEAKSNQKLTLTP